MRERARQQACRRRGPAEQGRDEQVAEALDRDEHGQREPHEQQSVDGASAMPSRGRYRGKADREQAPVPRRGEQHDRHERRARKQIATLVPSTRRQQALDSERRARVRAARQVRTASRRRSPSRRCSASARCSRSRPATPLGIQRLLFGDVLGATRGDLLAGAALVAVVLVALRLAHWRLLAAGFDRDGARALGARRSPSTRCC